MPRQFNVFRGVVAASAVVLVAGCGTSVSNLRSGDAAPYRVDQSRLTLAPLQFVGFCLRNDRECAQQGPAAVVLPWDPKLAATLEGVNRSVNARISPSRDEEVWRINPQNGNCNDYVVTKRHELLARGYPSSALLINVVRTPSGEGHLVLVVRTDQGDMVLDNLQSQIRTVAETPYRWIKRQTTHDPRIWENA